VEEKGIVGIVLSATRARHGRLGSHGILHNGKARIAERFQPVGGEVESPAAELGEQCEKPTGAIRMVTLLDLDQRPRPIAAKAFEAALEEGELVTFDVDLDESERRQIEPVRVATSTIRAVCSRPELAAGSSEPRVKIARPAWCAK